MLRIFAILTMLLLVGVFGRAALMPAEVRVEQTAVIAATPAKIMPFLDNLQSWGAWSWLGQQQLGKIARFSGSDSGVGAVHSWADSGGAEVGRLEIVALQQNALVDVRFDQRAPAARQVLLEFRLVPEAQATRVTVGYVWSRPLLARLRTPFGAPVAAIEAELEASLYALRRAVEAS